MEKLIKQQLMGKQLDQEAQTRYLVLMALQLSTTYLLKAGTQQALNKVRLGVQYYLCLMVEVALVFQF